MSYLSLHNTLSSDLVDLVTTLNNTWDQIDSKIKALDTGVNPVGTGIISPETALECASSQTAIPDVGVYNGTAWTGIKAVDTWGAWTNLNLQSGFNAVSGKTPQLRISDTGRIQLKGAIQYGTGVSAWPAGYQLINTLQFDAATHAPSIDYIHTMMATPTHTTTWAYGQLLADNLGVGSTLEIWICYVGTALASGNYVALDDAEWWAG